MLTALSIVIILLSFITVPFSFGVKIDGEIFVGKGEMKLTLFGIAVFKAKLRLENLGPTQKNIVVTSGKREEEIHLNADRNDKRSIVSLFHALPIMSYIHFDDLKVDVKVGFAYNAFATTMTVGILRTVLCAFTSFLRSRQNIDLYQRITPEYNTDTVNLEISGIIKLSVANIINSFIAGILNKLKIEGEPNGKRPAKAKIASRVKE